MAELNNLNLLSTTNRVEAPFIKVQIGNYTFGVYDKKNNSITYPNYVRELQTKKINGQVNKYTLTLIYPITERDDPNFFEKVFSSVSETRRIIFSYGDAMLPTYCYRNEQAIILSIKPSVSTSASLITYTITAVSDGTLASSVQSYSFPARYDKPSDIIKELLYSTKYGLQDLFYGMRDRSLVERYNLIPGDDRPVNIEARDNISILEYLTYLVNCMCSYEDGINSIIKSKVYLLTIYDDTTGVFNGTYFKIVSSTAKIEESTAYKIDVGYPSQNIVTNFSIKNDDTYSIYYNYSEKLNTGNYTTRINDEGEIEKVYAPTLISNNDKKIATEQARTWWTKMTQFPITVNLTIKGLLRPAILMTNIKLNIYFYGNKFIYSGIYVITEQVDNISAEGGYRTTLTMLRIKGDEEK